MILVLVEVVKNIKNVAWEDDTNMNSNKEQWPLFLSIIAIVISLVSCLILFKNAILQQEEFSSSRTFLLTAKFNRGIDIKGTIRYPEQELNLNSKIRFYSLSEKIKF